MEIAKYFLVKYILTALSIAWTVVPLFYSYTFLQMGYIEEAYWILVIPVISVLSVTTIFFYIYMIEQQGD